MELTITSNTIRQSALVSIHAAKSGHPGGALSCADIVAYLVTNELDWPNYNSQAPAEASRNRFVLSKGHACPVLYAAAARFGIISYEQLLTLRKLGSPLQGHTSVVSTPWAEVSTGSLAQGLSVAIGMALGLRYQRYASRVFALLGDGELQEGEIWEGVMSASHHKLSNLCAIVDYNKMQSDDLNENIIALEPLKEKWRAFNWHVIEIDGHDFDDIGTALYQARQTVDRPSVIIAHTIKGKGVSYMENSPLWHGSVTLQDSDLAQALHDLGAAPTAIHAYINHQRWGGTD